MRAYSVPADRELTAPAPRRGSLAHNALIIYPVFVLALTIASTMAPQRAGILAVGQIFEPLLFLPLLLLLPFAIARGMGGLRLALLLCLAMFVLRYLPPLHAWAPAPDPEASQISVLTWNAYSGNVRYDEVNQLLAARPADVVFLQEADSARIDLAALSGAYPYVLAEPYGAPPGMIFLSGYPIVTHGVLHGEHDLWDIPRLIWVRLSLGNGREVTVVGAHPMSAYTFGEGCRLPICYSPAWRDRQIEAMRDSFISPMLESGDAMVLAGDFNITEREPAYADLSRGLTDAWKALGTGFGTTWRPGIMMGQQLGLLRIDYLFASPSVRPLAVSVDCRPRGSDHCLVFGRFEIGR